MTQKLSVIGLGKLGCTMMACFAHKGWEVIGVDVNELTIETLKKSQSPIDEPHVEQMLIENSDRINVTTDYEPAILNSDASFIIVPTPSNDDGSFSTVYVEKAAMEIAKVLSKKRGYHLIIITSTVLPGDTLRIAYDIAKKSGKKLGAEFGVVYNPDFIALGKIVHDFLNPDMILIGEYDKKSGDIIDDIHRRLIENSPTIHRMNFYNAELAKISLNAYCTLKITFANVIAEICEKLPGGDSELVLKAVGSDSRVGNKYFKGGLGYSGPCLLPDALIQTDKGLKEIQDIDIGDRVFTHRGRLREVTEIYCREYIGDMVKIIPMGFPYCPIITTPDHPIWGAKRVQKTKERYRIVSTTGKKRLGPAAGLGKLEFISANEIEHGDLIALPILDIEEIDEPILKFNNLHHLSKVSEKTEIVPDIMRFFGFYISEGSTWKGEIKISLHKNETNYAEDVVEILSKYFNTKAVVKPHNENGIKARSTSAALARYLKETFGNRAENKKVPFEWLFLPERHFIELLRGIWYGDGSNSTDRFTYGTVSFELHRFLQLSLLRLGISFASKVQEKKISKDGTKHQKAYFLNISNDFNYKRVNEIFPELLIDKIPKGSKAIWIEAGNILFTIRSVKKINYEGCVYNLEVEEDNSYMLENSVVHNCFPRDNRALAYSARLYNTTNYFCEMTDAINRYHKTERICKILLEYMDEKEAKELAILGLSYKEDTPVIEESVSISVIKFLYDKGVKIKVYDPVAMENTKRELEGYGKVIYANSEYDCIDNTLVCFIATPWKQFHNLDPQKILKKMRKDSIILDAWGILHSNTVDALKNRVEIRQLGKNYQ